MDTLTAVREAPTYGVDFYSDEMISDPYPHYKAMRDLGPAVWLPQNRAYAITRFADVRNALRNSEVFQSGQGVMMDERVNAGSAGASLLTMDGPAHQAHRVMVASPLMPGALKPVQEEIQTIADKLVEDIVARGTFDGVKDFAHVLPLTLVSRLVGLPDDGREQMLEWANGIFNCMGGANARFAANLHTHNLAWDYLQNVKREDLLPESWGARLFTFVDSGALTEAEVRTALLAYVAPALDTTINATSSALWLFGQNPDQWDIVRADPALIPAALEEAMRLESPIRAFSRLLACDHEVDGVLLPAKSRALIVYASANRDERRWDDPERFDIQRKSPYDQLAFGTGAHTCAGMHLARLEMRCLFSALVRRVARFEVAEARRELHNVLRGLASVTVRITEVA